MIFKADNKYIYKKGKHTKKRNELAIICYLYSLVASSQVIHFPYIVYIWFLCGCQIVVRYLIY